MVRSLGALWLASLTALICKSANFPRSVWTPRYPVISVVLFVDLNIIDQPFPFPESFEGRAVETDSFFGFSLEFFTAVLVGDMRLLLVM